MSVSGTAHTAARHRSGRWVSEVATSSPPLLPPRTARRSRLVRPRPPASRRPPRSRRTPAACGRMPARCQSSPSSAPPRMHATANTPPSSATATAAGAVAGAHGDGEAAVAGEQRGRGRPGHDVVAAHGEQRDLGAVGGQVAVDAHGVGGRVDGEALAPPAEPSPCSAGAHRHSSDGRAHDVSAATAVSLSRSPATPARDPGSGSGMSSGTTGPSPSSAASGMRPRRLVPGGWSPPAASPP